MSRGVAALGAVTLLAALLLGFGAVVHTPPVAAQAFDSVGTATVATGSGCGDVSIRWNPVDGATGYTVEWDAGRGVSGTLSDTSSSNTRSVSGLPPGRIIIVTVTVNGGTYDGNNGSGVGRSGNTGCPRPDPPGSELALRVDAEPGCGEVGLHWDDVAGATSYGILWTTSSSSDITTLDANFYLIEHDRSGVDITIEVIVFGGAHDGTAETLETTTGDGDACDDGLNVTATGPSCGAISIQWSATPGATGYQVSWDAGDDSEQQGMETITASSATSYRHRVTELDSDTEFVVSVAVIGGAYSGETGSARVRSGSCATGTGTGTGTETETETEGTYPSSIYVGPGASLPGVGLSEPSYVRITLSDSDGIVSPGVTVTATAVVVNAQGNALSGAVPYEWSISGSALEFNNAAAGSSSRFRISIPSDTPQGQYTIRATGRGVSGVASLLVDDPGEPIGGIALELGRRGDDGRCTLGSQSTPPDASTARPGSEICLVVRVLNTLGNVTNSADVELITVRAPGGAINRGGTSAFFADTAQAGFTVSSASEGTVTVSATALGVNDVEARTVSTTLTFSAQAGNHEGAGYGEEGLHCLTRLAQFSVWVCDAEILASALFDEVALVGVTAIHRWNEAESSWQRYSTVAGLPIPGSEDFVIGRGQVLFFSH